MSLNLNLGILGNIPFSEHPRSPWVDRQPLGYTDAVVYLMAISENRKSHKKDLAIADMSHELFCHPKLSIDPLRLLRTNQTSKYSFPVYQRSTHEKMLTPDFGAI